MLPHPIHTIVAAQTGTLFMIFTTLVTVSCCVVAIIKERSKNANHEEGL